MKNKPQNSRKEARKLQAKSVV